MKKEIDIIRWIGVAVFCLMSVYALSEGGIFGALLLILGGLIIAPLNFVQKLRSKLKLNKTISIILAVVLLFAGVLATPTTEEAPTDDDIQITDSTSDDSSNLGKTTSTPNDNDSGITSKEESSDQEATVAPSTSEKVKETTPEPTISEKPETTFSPSTSTKAEETTSEPVTSAKPKETTVTPSTTVKPDETTPTPITSAKPVETTQSSVTSAKPVETTAIPTPSGVGTGKGEAVKLSDIPAYSGKAYVTVNKNIPNFAPNELKTTGYETYSSFDRLGRTQTAIASVGKDTMPKANDERGSISSIKPTGWIQAQYDCVSGGWLYNRCHLIGWQLSAENANAKNLITGTKYLNTNGMLPFENMVADYINETGNHVAYRITPIYQGNNLLASGVQMEAYSVEDNGAGICFNVFCYNVQPDITINYATGESSGPSSSTSLKEETTPEPAISSKPEETTAVPSTTAKPEEDTTQNDISQIVYITKTGKKYHSTKNCSGLNNANAIYDSTLSEALDRGLTPCSKCH